MRHGLALLLAAAPLLAHHATRAEFDDRKIVPLQGVVTETRWLNPHGSFRLEITDPTGSVTGWEIELPSPNGLMRQGWRREDLKRGDEVSLDVWVAKDGTHRATMRSLTLPDGRVFSGQSGWDNPVNSVKNVPVP